jgi:hypothetical protein
MLLVIAPVLKLKPPRIQSLFRYTVKPPGKMFAGVSGQASIPVVAMASVRGL